MTPDVWVAAERDLDAVTDLVAGFRDWWEYDRPADREIRRVARELLGDDRTEFLLASTGTDGEAVGLCQLRFRLSIWTGAEDCWLEDLYVRGDARRLGVGRALIEAAVQRARARCCRRIELDVNEQNSPALAFYEGLGFTTEPKPPGRTLFLGRRLD